jgi:hypothetical protein
VIQDASDIGVWTEVFHPEAATAMASLSSMSDIALPASLTPPGKKQRKRQPERPTTSTVCTGHLKEGKKVKNRFNLLLKKYFFF